MIINFFAVCLLEIYYMCVMAVTHTFGNRVSGGRFQHQCKAINGISLENPKSFREQFPTFDTNLSLGSESGCPICLPPGTVYTNTNSNTQDRLIVCNTNTVLYSYAASHDNRIHSVKQSINFKKEKNETFYWIQSKEKMEHELASIRQGLHSRKTTKQLARRSFVFSAALYLLIAKPNILFSIPLHVSLDLPGFVRTR